MINRYPTAECSALLCEAVQGLLVDFKYIIHMVHMKLMQHMVHAASIEDDDPGYEHDEWTVPSQTAAETMILRADRWYYKTMD
jgi:hypothetical protein